jgi:hypothetical protein
MEFKRFSNVRAPGDWEWGWVGWKYQLRIGRSQFAFWINDKPVFSFLYGFHNKNTPRVSATE